MPPVYLLTAAQCPPIQVPSSILKSATDLPTVAEVLTPGTAANDPLNGTALLNRNATRLDMLGRYGGGAWAVRNGLDFANGGGLTLRVNDGVVGLDTPRELIGAGGLGYTTQALSDNIYSASNLAVRIWLWLSRALTITPVNNSIVPPAGGPWVCLGSVRTNNGVIVDWDFSGRLELEGATLYRRTADGAAPTDSPPAGIRFWAETAGGIYLWNGSAYSTVAGVTSLAAALDTASLAVQLDDLGRRFRRLLLWLSEQFNEEPPGLEPDLEIATDEDMDDEPATAPA
jgi:hypothetical protein